MHTCTPDMFVQSPNTIELDFDCLRLLISLGNTVNLTPIIISIPIHCVFNVGFFIIPQSGLLLEAWDVAEEKLL